MLKPGTLTLLVLLLLAGCAPRHKQSIEPRELPLNFSMAETQHQQLPDRWWLAFNDPNLNRLMTQFFSSNLSLVQGHARLRQSAALMRQSRSLRYPNLTLIAQSGRSSQPGFTENIQGSNSQLSVAAGFELDLFGKLSSRSQAALLSYQASHHDLQSLYMSLAAQLADLYYLATEQRAQLKLVDQTVSRYQANLQRVEDRYRQGVTAAVDLYQARQNLASAKAMRPLVEQSLTLAENALAVLLGDYPGSQLLLQQAQLPEAPPLVPIGLPAELLTRRPDLRAALLRVEVRDAELAATIAERFPAFNLLGNLGYTRSDLTGSLLSGNFWNLLLSLSQPVFDAGRLKAKVALNRARLAEEVARYQESVLRAFREVEDALGGNLTSTARIDLLIEQEKATRAAQQLALDRYLFGVTDYLPVLNSQIFHFNTQSQLLIARRQLLSQRISLARALGGRWTSEQFETDHQRLAEQENGK